MHQLPQAEVVLVPVGGGGLIAGVAAAIKHINPQVLIYVWLLFLFGLYLDFLIIHCVESPLIFQGIEPDKCCCFFKAMENEYPYQTAIGRSVAESLGVPNAGWNAFHTARSLIDKMVSKSKMIIFGWSLTIRHMSILSPKYTHVLLNKLQYSIGRALFLRDILGVLKRTNVSVSLSVI